MNLGGWFALAAVAAVMGGAAIAAVAGTQTPGVAGTAKLEQTLTADTSGIADANGKTKADNGDTSYAWPAKANVRASSNATLKTLGPSLTLSPGFDPATFEYAGTMPNYVSWISFVPETSHSLASLAFLDADDMPLADANLNINGHQVNLTTGDNIIKVRVTAEDGITTRTYRITVTRRALRRITVRPRYPSFGAGVEDVQLDLVRDEPTTDAVTVTVNIAQEQTWLSSSYLSHQLTFAVGSDRVRLNLSKSWFSPDVPIRGNLTASVPAVAGYDVSQATGTVEMISIPAKPLTVELDKTAYTFEEDGDPEDVEILAVFTLHPAFPRPPADSGSVSVWTSDGTASSSHDYTLVRSYRSAQFRMSDFVKENGRFVARTPVRPSSSLTSRVAIVDDDVYEGSETFHVNLGTRYNSPSYLQYKRADGTFCEGTCTGIAYPVTITDEEDLPEFSLSVSRSSIGEEDDSATTDVTENVSMVTASVGNGKTFKEDRTITLTFGGTATAGTHYTVSPVDADSNTAGHQVTLTAGSSTVSVTLTANGNTAANTARTITVAGSRGGTSFGTTQTVTINDNDGSNNLPAFANVTATRSTAETVGDAAAQTAIDIGTALPAATDDDDHTLTYSLEGTDAASFGFDASARQLETKPGTVYDYEARSSYSVTVKADDGNGGTATTIVAVSLTNAVEVPAAPAAPTIAEVSGDPTVLSVSWGAPGNVGRPAIASYDIQYKETLQPGWTNGPQDQIGTSASIGSLTKDTEYQVQVRATNADGDGPWSLSGTGRTDDNTTPVYSADSVAISFLETVGNVAGTTVIDMGSHTATDGDGDPLTYSLDGPDKDKFTIGATNGHLWTKVGEIFDYEAQSSYSVKVKADDGKGGTATKAIDIDLFDASEAPLAPAAPTVSGGPLRLDVGWDAPNPARRPVATGYELRYKKTSDVGWTDGPQDLTRTNSSIGGLTLDTEYEVQVRAINGDGKSVWSSTGVGRTTDELGVTGLRATGTVDEVDLSWTAPQGTVLGYRIEVSHDGGSVWTDVEANTNSTDTRYTHHGGLAAGETRRYRVSAIITGGTIPSSEWAEVSATVVATGLAPLPTPGAVATIALCWFPAGVEAGDLRDFALRRKAVHPETSEDWGNQTWSPWGNTTAAQCVDGIGFRVSDLTPNVRYAFQLRARYGNGWVLSNSTEGVSVDTIRMLRTDVATGNSDLSGDTRVPDPVCPAYDDPATPENDAGSFIVNVGFSTRHPAFLNYEVVNGFDLAADVTLGNATAELVDQPYHHLLGYRVRITPTNWGEDVTVSVPAGAVTHAATLVENQASNEFRRKTSTATSCEPEPNPEPRAGRARILDNHGRDGEWTHGDRILVTLNFTEEMTVSTGNGVPTVSLRLEGNTTAVPAQYAGTGSSDSELVFEHHVGAGHGRVRRVEVVANSLALNGGEIVSSFGVTARLEHPGVTKRVRPAPGSQLTAEWTKFPPGHSGSGRTFRVRVQFSKPVTISAEDFRDHALSVTGGVIDRVSQIKQSDGVRRSDLWGVKVTPNSGRPVTLSLTADRDCSQQGAVCTASGRPLYDAVSISVPRPAHELTVADAEVQEGPDAALAFVVTLSGPEAAYRVKVDYKTADGTATAGQDYMAVDGTLIFERGEISKTVSVPVLDDSHDDGGETLSLVLSNPKRAMIVDGEAVGTIQNADPMPRAWLVRFGRTVALQALEAIGDRMSGARGTRVVVGGVELGGSGELTGAALDDEAAWPVSAQNRERPDLAGGEWGMTGRELLLGSAFQLDAGGEGGGPSWSAWGRFATSGFDGEEPGASLSGDVTTGFLGADVSVERWLAGLALGVSEGEGSFDDGAGGGGGTVQSSLTSVYPYARLNVGDGMDVWGLVGIGTGDLTLTVGEEVTESGLSMRMGALGLRSDLVQAADKGAFALAGKSDAMWVRTQSDAARSSTGGRLEAASGDVSRVRVALEGSRSFAMGPQATFTPRVELGVRHDAGDAETGTGVEVGVGLQYAAPAQGLTVEGSVRGLLAHSSDGYEEWGASGSIRLDPGASGRGVSLSITPVWGAASDGVERLWSARSASSLVGDDAFEAGARLEAEMGYGLGLAQIAGVLTPYVGLSVGEAGRREYRTGTRWHAGPHASVSLEASREETRGGGTATDALMLRASIRF